MKTLIVYYSRHGHTEKVANQLAKFLKADVELIVDNKDRKHLASWFRNSIDEELRTSTTIALPKKDPTKYDLVVIGTPIWDGIVPPVKAYLQMFKGKFKKVAFFSTFGASAENAFYFMEQACGKKPIATMEIQDRQIDMGEDGGRIKEFVGELG